jgi:hypothetical protein
MSDEISKPLNTLNARARDPGKSVYGAQRRKFDRLRAKQQAAAERQASVRHEYDRATQRSVFRSIQRALAGRWDGKMVRVNLSP